MVDYNEIRDYIQQKYGKRVSNKWIAEIKRKVGMLQFYVEGEEFEEFEQSCPKKAEECIIEAFEHFNIIDERNDLSKLNDELNQGYTVLEDK